MPHWIALVGVLHDFRLGRGARSEIQQQGIGGRGGTVGSKVPRAGVSIFKWPPSGPAVANCDTRETTRHLFESTCVRRSGDHVARTAALDSIGKIGAGEHG